MSSDDDNLHLPPGYPTGISSDERAKQQLKAAADSKKTKEEKAEEANKEPLPSELPLQLRVMQFSITIQEMLSFFRGFSWLLERTRCQMKTTPRSRRVQVLQTSTPSTLAMAIHTT
jgi:hypothetical protein